MTKTELLLAVQTTHDEFLAAIDAFASSELEQAQITDRWTPKDVMAHVTRWENICAHYLRYVLADEPIPLLEASTEELNARAFPEDHALTMDQVWENSDTSFAGVIGQLESLLDEQIGRPLRGPWLEYQDKTFPLSTIIGMDTYDHYPEHTQSLQAWLVKHGRKV